MTITIELFRIIPFEKSSFFDNFRNYLNLSFKESIYDES